ncbi:MAG: hypothetical protein Q9222_001014 [Ikaeria aurantiellina]
MPVLNEKVPVVIVQILTVLLSTQNDDGSWMPVHRVDTTAYATANLLDVIDLPYIQNLKIEIQCAIAKACAALALKQDKASTLDPTLDKEINSDSSGTLEILSYALQMLSLTNDTNHSVKSLGDDTVEAFTRQNRTIRKHIEYFSSLDHLRRIPHTRLKSAIIEANLYRPFLQCQRIGVFPASNAEERHEYLEYLPIMWLLATASYNVFAPPEFLVDMMTFSTRVFLADEYVKSKVAGLAQHEVFALRKHIEDSFEVDQMRGSRKGEQASEESRKMPSTSDRLLEVISVFTTFVEAVTNHPRVVRASRTDQSDLRFELKGFILRRLYQLEDNARLRGQDQQPRQQHIHQSTESSTPQMPFSMWVHQSGSGDSGCHLFWAFFTCILGGSLRNGQNCLPTLKQRLMAHTMITHHSAFYRLCKEHGSRHHDMDRANPSCVDFPEIPGNVDDKGVASPDSKLAEAEAKLKLLDAARFERQSASNTAELLYQELEAEAEVWGDMLADRIRVFVGAGEQFSDMYLIRDVMSSVK